MKKEFDNFWLPSFFFASLLCLLFSPMTFDDGWVLATVDTYQKTNRYGYVFILNNAEYSLVRPYFWVMSKIFSNISNENLYLFFIPSTSFVLLSYWLMRKTILLLEKRKVLLPQQELLLFSAFSVFLLIGPTGQTLRPDVFVLFGLIFNLFVFFRNRGKNPTLLFDISIMYNAIMLSFHPLALINFFSCATTAFLIYFEAKKLFSVRFILITIAAGITSILFILWDQSYHEFFNNLALISTEENHKHNFKGELIRFTSIAYEYGAPGLIITYGTIFVALFMLVKKSNFIASILALGTMVVLLILPSKWSQYSVFFLPSFSILFCSLLAKNSRPNSRIEFFSNLFLRLTPIVFCLFFVVSFFLILFNVGNHGKFPSKSDELNSFFYSQNEVENLIAPALFHPAIPSKYFVPFDKYDNIDFKKNIYTIKRQSAASCSDLNNIIVSNIRFGNSTFIFTKVTDANRPLKNREIQRYGRIVVWLKTFDAYRYIAKNYPIITDTGLFIIDFALHSFLALLNQTMYVTLEDNFARKLEC